MQLLSVQDIFSLDIEALFVRTQAFLREKNNGRILGASHIHMNIFLEPSTRTALSFEMATKRLGGQVISFVPQVSSLKKEETLTDTLDVLLAMSPDSVAVRSASHNLLSACAHMCRARHIALFNAGDGTLEHPTQALTDAFVIWRQYGGFSALKVVICGDIAHSRVAHSNEKLLTHLGAQVVLVGPGFSPNLSLAAQGAHVLMALRVQKERMPPALLNHDETLEPYATQFQLNRAILSQSAPGCIVMHPGPINRGIEIESSLADDPAVSKILDQVEAGVAMRMALLEWAMRA